MRFTMILLLIIGFAWADKHEEDNHHYYKKDFTFLELSNTQKASLKQILEDYRTQMRNYKQYERNQQKQKQDIFLSNNFDASKIIKLNQDLTAKASAIEGNFLSKIHKLLNTQQRKKFVNYIDEWEID
jgi:Spy/CpxP family protein refolding chaperone